jgi:hypothetical protein
LTCTYTHDEKLMLGHDRPTTEVSYQWLQDHADQLWIHAKTLRTLIYLHDETDLLHFFYHAEDAATLTSRGYIWTYPRESSTFGRRSVMVLPEKCWNIEDAMTIVKEEKPYAICTDHLYTIKSALEVYT